MSIKINTLEVENLKRIKAVKLSLENNALTVIGGKNGEGKTSVLDAITYALGGERYRPSEVKRDGSLVDPEIRLTLSNGITVERRGKNSSLKVTDPNGAKAGQQLLNEFLHVFALDLPKFMGANDKEKANTLLQVIGVGDELERLDKAIKEKYDNRHTKGQIADQKKKYADEMQSYPDAPEELISASELIKQQQEIFAKNGENERKRKELAQWEEKKKKAETKLHELRKQVEEAEHELAQVDESLATARKTAEQLQDESTAEIEKSLAEIEETNTKARANLDKAKAVEDAESMQAEYQKLSEELEAVRQERKALLDGANLPLPELSVVDGELTYRGQRWDCMSGAEQMKVATAIVHKLNPECGFVLLDKLEAMDADTLAEFGQWLESEGLQAIATRVSTGGECSVVIEDGIATQDITISEPTSSESKPKKKIEKGEF